MRGGLLVLPLLLSLGTSPGFAQAPVTAFVDVAVAPMDRERVLQHQTVVVRGARIVAIGPASQVPVPTAALRIDGRGKFLIPGLGDMHVHLTGGVASLVPESLKVNINKPDTVDPNGAKPSRFSSRPRPVIDTVAMIGHIGLMYLASGVTTVRDMWGSPMAVAARERVAKGEILSPRIYVGSPWFKAPTPDSAKRLVAQYQTVGYDFLKIHITKFTPEVLDTLIAATRRAKLPIAGHVPGGVTFEQWISASPRSIEHLTGFLTKGDSGRIVVLDESAIRARAALMKRTGTWFTPTRMAMEIRDIKPLLTEVESSYPKIIKILHEAGVGFLLGTDGPQLVKEIDAPTLPPNLLVAEELAMLVEAGLTPYQALETGTRNVAMFLGTLDSMGTVEVGKRADVVLLDGNPLERVRSIAYPSGVMLGGRWFSRADFASRFAALGLPKDWY